jgi:hypothetical protein
VNQRKQSVIEKQVTLEEQMICGALQTLNEEACEDVLEETEEKETKITIEPDVPQTSIIPPSPDSNQGESLVTRKRSTERIKKVSYDESVTRHGYDSGVAKNKKRHSISEAPARKMSSEGVGVKRD